MEVRSLRREMEQVQRNSLPKRERLEAVCNSREVENAQGLDKLPKEVWERITGNLDDSDLFPLALSCRYFREKQKELVARTRQSGPESGKPPLALKTNLWPRKNQPASADYLRFCSKDDVSVERAQYIRCLAAFHGHLPLLKELLAGLKIIDPVLSMEAGESSLHSFFCFILSASDFWLSLFHSARRPTGDLAVAENPEGLRPG